jgi:hypothetical protein
MTFRRFDAVMILALLMPAAAHAQIAEGEPPRADVAVNVGIYGPADPQVAAIYAQTRETRSDMRDAVDAGRMSRHQGKSFKRQSRRIDSMADRYSNDGTMTASAGRELDMAARALDSMANAPAARATAHKDKR